MCLLHLNFALGAYDTLYSIDSIHIFFENKNSLNHSRTMSEQSKTNRIRCSKILRHIDFINKETLEVSRSSSNKKWIYHLKSILIYPFHVRRKYNSGTIFNSKYSRFILNSRWNLMAIPFVWTDYWEFSTFREKFFLCAFDDSSQISA